MVATIPEAKARLEADGLYVSSHDGQSLFIAGHLRDVGDGLMISNDACTVFQLEGRWYAAFPYKGMVGREVSGSLSDMVALIEAVYRHYQSAGGDFAEAVSEVIDGAGHSSQPVPVNGPPALHDASSVPQPKS